MYTLGELADRFDLRFSGDAQKVVSGMSSLGNAGASELAFLDDRKYLPQLADTAAAAVLLEAEFVPHCPVDTLVCESPYLVFARLSRLFNRAPRPEAGVHPAAVVSEAASLHDTVRVAPQAVIEAGAVLEANVCIGAGAYVGHDSYLGSGTRVHANAVICHGVILGQECVVHSQAVLGADGFGFAQGPGGWEKIHQSGGLRIGNNVDIGAATTVDRGTLDDTVIEDGVIIDNQVQVAHNCRIGKNTAIAGCVGLAGSTIIGAHCTLSGGVGVVGHVEICDNVHVTGMTMVTRSITEPGSYSSGTPMSKTAQWKRSAVRFSQLDSIQQRLVALERKRETD